MSTRAQPIRQPVGSESVISGLIRRLAFRKKAYEAIYQLSILIALELSAVVAFGALDHFLPLHHFLRASFVFVIIANGLAIIAILIWRNARLNSLADSARIIEKAAGRSNNVLVTYAEMVNCSEVNSASRYFAAGIERQTVIEWREIENKRVVRPKAALFGIACLFAVIFVIVSTRVFMPSLFFEEASRLLFLSADKSPLINNSTPSNSDGSLPTLINYGEMTIRITPPAYTGLSPTQVNGDAPIRVLVNSKLDFQLRVTGPAQGAHMSFGGAASEMRFAGAGGYEGTLKASSPGAVEIKLLGDDRLVPPPLVRSIDVYGDTAPEAKIDDPKSDQLLATIPERPMTIRWSATDDIGLDAVTLKYIRSRGDGDAAKFLGGEVPVAVAAKESSRKWSGLAQFDLRKLEAQSGDSFVVWLEARDKNPFANNTGRSGSLIIAIPSPEQAKLNLGDLKPNEISRFLLSERQIIINTERLHASRRSISSAEFLQQSNNIASDQREFKNSFSQLINIEGGPGEVSSTASVEERAQAAVDERTEVHNHGIPDAPEGAPDHVRDLILAIRSMWDAEDALSIGDTSNALVAEKAALAGLKRAQTSVRYIPPIAAKHSPVDQKRRYQGELTEIKSRLERYTQRGETKNALAIREALGDMYLALRYLSDEFDLPQKGRSVGLMHAQEKIKSAGDRLVNSSSQHSALVAESAGQLRIVETELSRIDPKLDSAIFSERLTKLMALMRQATSTLFAVVDSRTTASGGTGLGLLKNENSRTAEYFRLLNSGDR
jgi:hypothetical protein